MKKEFIKPDYTNGNINISATLAEFLGAPNNNKTLPLLKEELTKNYKNVVFICFDGLGINPIKKNLSNDDFLVKNIKQVLTSTFPSTTTNATTTLLTNKLPLEHGWFGWSMNFEKINKNIDIFKNNDSWTGEHLNITDSPLENFDYYFDNAKSDYAINTIFPEYVNVANELANNVYSDEDEFFDFIFNICKKEGKQFIYAYYPDPDHTMHEFGVSSLEAQMVIKSISKKLEKLNKTLQDTIFIVTADHGQVDIDGYTEIYNDKEIMDMLEIYPYMEARATCFKVKSGKEKEFEEIFNQRYSRDYTLYKSEDLISQGYFGNRGTKAFMLGTYIAVGTYTHKQMVLTPNSHKFKGHHTSLTEEMEVPLIIISKK